MPDKEFSVHDYIEPLLSPDGRLIAAHDGVWDAQTGNRRLQVTSEAPGAYHGRLHSNRCVFSPDSKTLVSANGGAIYVFDMLTGSEVGRFSIPDDVQALASSPDGLVLASGHRDSSIYLWALRARLGIDLPKESLSQNELASCWKSLAGRDMARAYRATWKLAAFPTQSLPFLREKLSLLFKLDHEITTLIQLLDNDNYLIREDATRRLTNLGVLAKMQLQKALTETRSAEIGLRARAILVHINKEIARGKYSTKYHEAWWSVQILERIGSEQAVELLTQTSELAPNSEIKRDAQLALARLTSRLGKAAP